MMNFHRTIGIWIAMLKQDQDLGDETLEISRLIVDGTSFPYENLNLPFKEERLSFRRKGKYQVATKPSRSETFNTAVSIPRNYDISKIHAAVCSRTGYPLILPPQKKHLGFRRRWKISLQLVQSSLM